MIYHTIIVPFMLNSSIFLTARIFRDKLVVRAFSLKILPYRGLIGKYFGFLGLSTAQAYACVKIFFEYLILSLAPPPPGGSGCGGRPGGGGAQL
jgi:hypothetical protein